MSRVVRFTFTNSAGVEFEHELPAVMEVCGRCEGYGTHLHPDIGGHAYTLDEFRETFDDEEAGEYMTRGGRYDVTCHVCAGQNVVAVVDEAGAERTTRGRRLLALWRSVEETRAHCDAEAAAERRYLARLMGDR